MVLEVLKYPDPRLRKKGLSVRAVTPEMQELARNMLETMAAESGIGLAAPQVGESLRLLVIDTRPTDDEGNVTGLGIFPGRVVRFQRPPEFKIPHMGWNTVRFAQERSPLAAGLATTGESFYFVHSFHCVPADRALILAESDYGGAFTAAIARGRCFATQFHPEKSQAKGLQIYRNFATVAGAEKTAAAAR